MATAAYTHGASVAAHARSVREAKGKPVGRPKKLNGETVAAVRAAVDSGMSARDVAAVHGVSKHTVYRALNTESSPA